MHAPGSPTWDELQGRALDALASAEARGAFRIDREDPRLRDRYGRHIHGQCLLLARRLVEAGVRLVTVNWHDDGQNFWDTHGDNFNRLKNRPDAPGRSRLLRRCWTTSPRAACSTRRWSSGSASSAGRRRITAANAGREHWPRCYSAVLAGGGIRGGHLHGASDRWGAYPARDPVSPDDLGATIFHALGIDPATEIPDPLGRPMRINHGRPVCRAVRLIFASVFELCPVVGLGSRCSRFPPSIPMGRTDREGHDRRLQG